LAVAFVPPELPAVARIPEAIANEPFPPSVVDTSTLSAKPVRLALAQSACVLTLPEETRFKTMQLLTVVVIAGHVTLAADTFKYSDVLPHGSSPFTHPLKATMMARAWFPGSVIVGADSEDVALLQNTVNLL
jgi:hypothetical protein